MPIDITALLRPTASLTGPGGLHAPSSTDAFAALLAAVNDAVATLPVTATPAIPTAPDLGAASPAPAASASASASAPAAAVTTPPAAPGPDVPGAVVANAAQATLAVAGKGSVTPAKADPKIAPKATPKPPTSRDGPAQPEAATPTTVLVPVQASVPTPNNTPGPAPAHAAPAATPASAIPTAPAVIAGSAQAEPAGQAIPTASAGVPPTANDIILPAHFAATPPAGKAEPSLADQPGTVPELATAALPALTLPPVLLPSTPAPAATAPVRLEAGAPPSAADQVAPALVQLSAGPAGGTVTVRLDPAGLGHVQVRVERTLSGSAVVHVAVEQPETLRMIVADQPALHRALDSAGVPQEARSLSIVLAPAAPADTGSTGGNGASFAGGAGTHPGGSSGNQPGPGAQSGGQGSSQGGSQSGSQSGSHSGGSARQDRPSFAGFVPPASQPGAWLRAGVDITA